MSELSLKEILARLPRHKRSGKGYSSPCPSHEDRSPSLLVMQMPSGFVHLRCYAGCTRKQVLAAMGLGNAVAPRIPAKRQPRSPMSAPDFDALLQECLEDSTTAQLKILGDELGVSIESLRALGTRWNKRDRVWYFPMRDQACKVIGIRVRGANGKKWSVDGSRNGLFIPSTFSPIGPILVAEGPTDAAALFDLGYAVVGRPNCDACVDMILAFLADRRRDVVICANRDAVHHRKVQGKIVPGSDFYPGQDGAIALANRMNRPVKILLAPGHKDFRQWKTAGATRNNIEFLISNTRWFTKTAQGRSAPPQGNKESRWSRGCRATATGAHKAKVAGS